MRHILAYGDSNTWGYIPGTLDPVTLHCERYPVEIRWPGVLRKLLLEKEHVVIIEEGLPGRTIATSDSLRPGINGMDYLYPCLLSYQPIDMVLIMLGTNDLKPQYQLSAEKIAEHMSQMCDLIKSRHVSPKGKDIEILIIAPPIIDTQKLSSDMYPYFEGVDEKSAKLVHYYDQLAQAKHYLFCDASQISTEKSDGVHFDKEAHAKLGKMLAKMLLNA